MRNPRLSFSLLAAALFALALGGHSRSFAAEAPWWNEDWPLRYEIQFDHLGLEGSEVAVVSFRPDMGARQNPYDVRAVDAEGTIHPVKVLYWSPEGKATFLIGPSSEVKGPKWTVYLYCGNPEARVEYYAYPWKNPTLLIGSQLKRGYQRHGEWRWTPDPRFGAVHLGIAAEDPAVRGAHAVTNIDSINVHPTRTRFAQMIWLDPAFPVTAFSIDLFVDRGIISLCWTDEEKPPKNSIATSTPIKVGKLPPTGEWVLVEFESSLLKLRGGTPLTGIGFSTHGGNMKWGPTALGGVPVEGSVVNKQKLEGAADSARRIETTPIGDEIRDFFPRDVLQLNLIGAPLFAESGAPLPVTYFLSPHYKYLGDLPDCDMEIVGVYAGDVERSLMTKQVRFVGGDNWQKTVEIMAADWRDAEKIVARVLGRNKQSLAEAVLRLAPLGPVPGLKPNGNMLIVGSEVLTFLPSAGTGRKESASGGAPIYFRAALAENPPEVVAINGNDPRLGLDKRVSDFSRRTAAEWVVAACNAAAGADFNQAQIVVDPEFLNIGVSLQQSSLFLAGIIRILKTAPDMRVELNLRPLRDHARTPRDQALLAACSEALPLTR
jgi:hypothetical protein